MRGKIYKAVPTITKEEILAICEYEEISEYGDVMTYENFIENVDNYCIMDYDGSGELMLFGKVVKHTSTWISDRCIYFRDALFVPFETLYELFGDDVSFIWFNK